MHRLYTIQQTASSLTNASAFERVPTRQSISHYKDIERHITRLPQFKDTEELFHCLAQFNEESETVADLSRFENLITSSDDPTSKYEVIIENQRGVTTFGIPLYSKQSLLYPFDPPKYQTLKGNEMSDLNLYPLPGKEWEWSWPNWHVLMIKDVDEEGWVYSRLRFRSRNWKGVARFGNFVRRRVWVRLSTKVTEYSKELLGEILPPIIVVDSNQLEEENNSLTVQPSGSYLADAISEINSMDGSNSTDKLNDEFLDRVTAKMSSITIDPPVPTIP